MRILEFTSVVCFLIACSAGDSSYVGAIFLLLIAGICALLSEILPKRRRKKRKTVFEERRNV